MKEVALILFRKNPELGKVKTRLAASLGDDKALAIYEQLVQLTLTEAEKTNFELFSYFSSFIPTKDPKDKGHSKVQVGSDLGERMKNAFEEVFSLGFKKVLIIGTDCPEISSKTLIQASQKLDNYELVIGPAEDGGYYLLGMRALQKDLFEGIAWSTDSVLERTLSKSDQNGLKVCLLEKLNDIDTAEDLNTFLKNHPEYESVFGYYN